MTAELVGAVGEPITCNIHMASSPTLVAVAWPAETPCHCDPLVNDNPGNPMTCTD